MQIEFSTLDELAYEVQGEARTYSGRGMYGKSCAGITLDSDSDLIKLGAAIYRSYVVQDDDLQEALADSARLDSMGRGIIVYWPSIEVIGAPEEDEDEE